MSVSQPIPVLDSIEEGIISERMREYQAQFAVSFVRYGVAGTSFTGLLAIVARLIRPQYPQFGWAAALCGVIVAVSGLYLVLQRRGQGHSAMLLFLLVFIPTIAMAPLLLPSMLLGAAICMLLPVLLSFLFLERWWAWGLTGASVAVVVADVALANTVASDWFPSLPAALETAIKLVVGSLAFVAIGLIIRAIVISQAGSFRTAQYTRLQLEKKAREEQAQREQLERAQGEIEQRIAAEKARAEELQVVLRQTREAAAALGAAAAEILAATTQQATGANEQSAAVTQASTTINQIRAIAGQTADHARGVVDLAQQAGEVTRSGQQAVGEALAGMQAIKQKVDRIAQNVLELSERAQTIGTILAAVSEIASQSNMLALNAAVEAARAGEAGRGFAVVAQEVRALAEQSKAATVQVGEILSDIQRGVNTAVMTTEEGIKGSDVGMHLVVRAGETIDHLAARVQDAAQASVHIATAAGQQLTGMEQLATAMESVQQAASQTVAGARQSERAAHALNDLAGRLREVVQAYGLQ